MTEIDRDDGDEAVDRDDFDFVGRFFLSEFFIKQDHLLTFVFSAKGVVSEMMMMMMKITICFGLPQWKTHFFHMFAAQNSCDFCVDLFRVFFLENADDDEK